MNDRTYTVLWVDGRLRDRVSLAMGKNIEDAIHWFSIGLFANDEELIDIIDIIEEIEEY